MELDDARLGKPAAIGPDDDRDGWAMGRVRRTGQDDPAVPGVELQAGPGGVDTELGDEGVDESGDEGAVPFRNDARDAFGRQR
ncbi:MAG: hypothetical protein HYV63_24440 [Candidatus Schekmanbacteria bacterium]|nr:hypothetical protein [Candidatus Schekmanbacteria bacterium]